MNSKIHGLFALLVLTATVLQTSEAFIFTVGGLWLDSNIAFVLFGKFLHYFNLLVVKRDVSLEESRSWGTAATPDQYLSVATSVDSNRCIPLAVCAAMAKSTNSSSTRDQFDNMVISTFQKKIKEQSTGAIDKSAPLFYYVEAAKFGLSAGSPDNCRLVSPTCKYSFEELSQLTKAALQ